jgi:hypothetical protein
VAFDSGIKNPFSAAFVNEFRDWEISKAEYAKQQKLKATMLINSIVFCART